MVVSPYIRICIWLSPIPTLGGEPREDRGNNRSVMPFDVLGRTRATLLRAPGMPLGRATRAIGKTKRAGDWRLIFFFMNEEFLVHTSQQLVWITSLPFVHTARRYYRWNGLVSCGDLYTSVYKKPHQTCSFRGSKSRNKVSVGEPAEGWLTSITSKSHYILIYLYIVMIDHHCELVSTYTTSKLYTWYIYVHVHVPLCDRVS